MEKITEITRRDIVGLFKDGIDVDILFEIEKVTYPYFGRLDEIEFLNRLYDLKSMESLDSRFSDAERDLWQHTVNNNDYPFCWVFDDDRFQLNNGSDEIYLKFICEIFHPAVRDEKGHWKKFIEEINKLLQNDGYELYPMKKISNRDVYGWRNFNSEETKLFIPYSQRNQKLLLEKQLVVPIKRKVRHQIYQLLEKYNSVYRETDETGWNYDITTSEKVFNDIRQFYTPKCYNSENKYVETSNLKDFVYYSAPYCVIDVIELFEKYNRDNDFEAQVNAILKLNDIHLILCSGKIESTIDYQFQNGIIEPVQEAGLKELLQEATRYYGEGNLNIAVEKLWDAFERLKTYYSPTLDKKNLLIKLSMIWEMRKRLIGNCLKRNFMNLQ